MSASESLQGNSQLLTEETSIKLVFKNSRRCMISSVNFEDNSEKLDAI